MDALSFDSIRGQLQQMGHEVPDDVIASVLKDLSMAVDGPDSGSTVPQAAGGNETDDSAPDAVPAAPSAALGSLGGLLGALQVSQPVPTAAAADLNSIQAPAQLVDAALNPPSSYLSQQAAPVGSTSAAATFAYGLGYTPASQIPEAAPPAGGTQQPATAAAMARAHSRSTGSSISDVADALENQDDVVLVRDVSRSAAMARSTDTMILEEARARAGGNAADAPKVG